MLLRKTNRFSFRILLSVILVLIFLTPLSGCTVNPIPAPPPSVTTKNGWTSFTDGNHINNLLLVGNELWAATTGGIVRWDINKGTYQKYTADDGLLGNMVYSIAQDNKGNLWCGTDNGISRFDGKRWQTIDTTTGILSSVPVESVAADNKGNIWFYTETSGHMFSIEIIHYNGQTWKVLPVYSPKIFGSGGPNLSWNGLYPHILIDRNNNIWIIEDYSIGFYDGQKWEDQYGNWNGQTFLHYPFNCAIFSKDGNLWVGDAEELVRCDGESLTTFSPDKLYVNNTGNGPTGITALTLNRKGDLICANGNTILRFDGKAFQTLSFNKLSSSPITSLAVDENGNIWCGTDDGIYRFDYKSWKAYLTNDPMLDTDGAWQSGGLINSLSEDHQGNIWLGTQRSGVNRFDGSHWTLFNTANGLSGNNITAVAQDSSGNLWVGNDENSIDRFDGTSWQTFYTRDIIGETGYNVTSIFEDSSGILWFGLDNGGGAVSFNGSEWQTHPSVYRLAYISGIIEDRNGNLWLSSDGSTVMSYNGTKWQSFDNFGISPITSMMVDHLGNVWVATSGNGVFYYDGSAWHHFTAADGLGSDSISIIKVDRIGNIWCGTNGNGVSRYDGKKWTNFTQDDGLIGNNVGGIAIGKDGSVWFNTYNGVSRYKPG